MYKYFNFSKIFEAEQAGTPLTPEEMGTPTLFPGTDEPTEDVESTQSSTEPVDTEEAPQIPNREVSVDYEAMAKTHNVSVLFDPRSLEELGGDKRKAVIEGNFQNKQNGVTGNLAVKVNFYRGMAGDDENTLESTGINIALTDDQYNMIKDALMPTAENTSPKPMEGPYKANAAPKYDNDFEVYVKLALDPNAALATDPKIAVNAGEEQLNAGAAPPPPVDGELKENRLLSFSQFINESRINEFFGEPSSNAPSLKSNAIYKTQYKQGAIRMKNDGKASILDGPGMFILIDPNTVFTSNGKVAIATARVGTSWDDSGIDKSLGRPSDLLGIHVLDTANPQNDKFWKYLKTKPVKISWSAGEPQTIYMEGDNGSYLITPELSDMLVQKLQLM